MCSKVLTWEDGVQVVRDATPDDEPAPRAVVRQCAPSQMRVALHRLDLLATVNAIAALDPEAAIVWEFAQTIYRDSPFIAALASNPVQPFTEAEIDAIFDAAMAIDF